MLKHEIQDISEITKPLKFYGHHSYNILTTIPFRNFRTSIMLQMRRPIPLFLSGHYLTKLKEADK